MVNTTCMSSRYTQSYLDHTMCSIRISESMNIYLSVFCYWRVENTSRYQRSNTQGEVISLRDCLENVLPRTAQSIKCIDSLWHRFYSTIPSANLRPILLPVYASKPAYDNIYLGVRDYQMKTYLQVGGDDTKQL